MSNWIDRVWNTFKVFVLFMGCTLLFYYGILWVSEEYESYHRYDEPKGRAVKVFNMDQEEHTSILDRLLFFYHFGE